jgi:hypothetical protein
MNQQFFAAVFATVARKLFDLAPSMQALYRNHEGFHKSRKK